MKYFIAERDKYGFVNSIDNVVIVYYLRNGNMSRIADELMEIRDKCCCPGWERLNCGMSVKYNMYQNTVHIDAIHIQFGKYSEYDKVNRVMRVLPILRLEVNPNKHYDEVVFEEVMKWIRDNCASGDLVKYDYAIDVPYNINDIQVFGTRKTPGLYKGTRYWGIRSNHGFLKIYNKAEEQGLDEKLTRIEYTLDPRKNLSLEKIFITDPHVVVENYPELDSLNKCIVSLCLALDKVGFNFEPYISKLNYRRRERIRPYLYGGTFELEYDEELLNRLLDKVDYEFSADRITSERKAEFETVVDGDVLPFS